MPRYFLLGAALLLLGGCADRAPHGTNSARKAETTPLQPLKRSPEPTSQADGTSQLEKLHAQHLPNAIRIHGHVISGGLPDGDQAFAELAQLGVRTVISVDGAKPDVAAAARYGLRYVHLPHGYDGIPETRVKDLAKAVRDLDGPIYIHCHHGKHRSPAAASAACVTAGLIPAAHAFAILDFAGTSPKYKGLYRSAASAHALSPAELTDHQVEFQDAVRVPPMAEAMVAIEHHQDHLKQFAASGWKPLAEHPDLDADHEALLLREQFTELLRLDEIRSRPQAFLDLLRESESVAEQLEGELQRASEKSDSAPQLLTTHVERLAAACVRCHEQFRDQPRP